MKITICTVVLIVCVSIGFYMLFEYCDPNLRSNCGVQKSFVRITGYNVTTVICKDGPETYNCYDSYAYAQYNSTNGITVCRIDGSHHAYTYQYAYETIEKKYPIDIVFKMYTDGSVCYNGSSSSINADIGLILIVVPTFILLVFVIIKYIEYKHKKYNTKIVNPMYPICSSIV